MTSSDRSDSQTRPSEAASERDLTPSQVVALQALWELRGNAHTSAQDVRERAVANGHARSLSTIRRALDVLVQRGYADRFSWRYASRPERHVRYWATRRPGETIPKACIGSKFRMWLWEGRMEWRLWALHIGERMVWIDNWGHQASAEDWEWLATRPALVLDGEPAPDDPAWWEDPSAIRHHPQADDDTDERPELPRLTVEQYDELVEAGLIASSVELVDQRLLAGSVSAYVFAMKEARAAEALGIAVHSAVDEVLADKSAVDELLDRLLAAEPAVLARVRTAVAAARGREQGEAGR